MLKTLHNQTRIQYFIGLAIGFLFGFLLQKGGVCYYDIIMQQLLLQDFTVVKIILTAIVTGMVGIYAMRDPGWINLHKKSGSLGATIPGPLIFGVGFAILGYCPGTSMGAAGHGALDAIIGGIIGIMAGAGLYAAVYPQLKKTILPFGSFGDKTLIDLFQPRNPWFVIIPVAVFITGFLAVMEIVGL